MVDETAGSNLSTETLFRLLECRALTDMEIDVAMSQSGILN